MIGIDGKIDGYAGATRIKGMEFMRIIRMKGCNEVVPEIRVNTIFNYAKT